MTDSRDTSATAAEGGREANQHGTRLAMTFEELLGDDETTDESASDIIRAVRAWRDVTSSATNVSKLWRSSSPKKMG